MRADRPWRRSPATAWSVSESSVARSNSRSLTSSANVTSRPTDLGAAARCAPARRCAPRRAAQAVGAAAERGREQRERHVLQHADRGEAERGEPLLGGRPDAPELAHRQIAQAAVHVGVGELADAGRLVHAGGELGQQLGGPDADGAGEVVRVADRSWMRRAMVCGGPNSRRLPVTSRNASSMDAPRPGRCSARAARPGPGGRRGRRSCRRAGTPPAGRAARPA